MGQELIQPKLLWPPPTITDAIDRSRRAVAESFEIIQRVGRELERDACLEIGKANLRKEGGQQGSPNVD
jgi:hypothetical protein